MKFGGEKIKKSILLVLVDRPHKNLGGQERRWIRLANYLKLKNSSVYDVITNKITLDLVKNTEINLKSDFFYTPDLNSKIFDNLLKNILVIYTGIRYKRIYFSNQSAFLLPAAIVLKYIFKKIIFFSYNGTSLNIHNNGNYTSYYNIIKLMHYLSDKTEILNPRLIEEGWLNVEKVSIAPCSFSDSDLFSPLKKSRTIAFAGHFYENKGINLLKKIILSSEGRNYSIKVYGDSIDGYPESNAFKAWLSKESLVKPYLETAHLHDMSTAFSAITVFLSFQLTSNYPSQSVIEALYSGAAILMTNSGDSKKFGEFDAIQYISSLENIDIIWNKIDQLNEYSIDNSLEISKFSKDKFSLLKYVEFIEYFFGMNDEKCN